jgi:hypothetical protein
MTSDSAPAARRLNHVEMVYRPGERELAKRVFELLGCKPVDRGGTFVSSLVDPDSDDFSNNVVYASEVTAEQWDLECALVAELEGDTAVGKTARAYLARLAGEPQRSFHFGMRLPTLEALEAAVARVRDASSSDPDLKGRVHVSGVFHPGDPGAYTDTMVQAFVRTDVVAAGLLAFGQHIELQWHLPKAEGSTR